MKESPTLGTVQVEVTGTLREVDMYRLRWWRASESHMLIRYRPANNYCSSQMGGLEDLALARLRSRTNIHLSSARLPTVSLDVPVLLCVVQAQGMHETRQETMR